VLRAELRHFMRLRLRGKNFDAAPDPAAPDPAAPDPAAPAPAPTLLYSKDKFLKQT
jgi:hypothetical protein